MFRVQLSTPTLFALLRAEFHVRRPPGCHACQVPLPRHLDDDRFPAPNWDASPAGRCPHDACVLARIVEELKVMYDLAP